METGGSWLELPIDVQVEIFCRILEDRRSCSRNEELISLKIICKNWNFVISRFCVPNLCPPNPRAPFMGILGFHEPSKVLDEKSKSLTLRYMPTLPFFLWFKKAEDNILSLFPSQELEADNIRDCCNGMMLITASNSSSKLNSQYYYVANPLTRQRFAVPVNHNRSTIHCSLVFDPSVLLSDDKDHFFKILSFVRPAQEATVSHPMEVDIYSSDKGEWCTHVFDLEPHQLYGFGWLERSVYFNRALYSLSLAMHLVCIDNVIPTPSSSMQDLRVWTIALPDKDETPTELIPNPGHCGCIGNCSGRFYYSNRDVQGSFISVWMLGNSNWVLMHKISIREDIGRAAMYPEKMEHEKKLDCFRPRVFYPSDGDGMILVVVLPTSYYTYNVKTKETSLQYVRNPRRTRPWNDMKVAGNWFFPITPCPLLLNATTKIKV
ncbi:hypothetical protein OROMI_009828 [Orobanche minor]